MAQTLGRFVSASYSLGLSDSYASHLTSDLTLVSDSISFGNEKWPRAREARVRGVEQGAGVNTSQSGPRLKVNKVGGSARSVKH